MNSFKAVSLLIIVMNNIILVTFVIDMLTFFGVKFVDSKHIDFFVDVMTLVGTAHARINNLIRHYVVYITGMGSITL